MEPELHSLAEARHTPALWHPLGFFDDLKSMSVLVLLLTALTATASIAFLILTFRTRVERFFSMPLFLSLIPYILCALITVIQYYSVIGFAPEGATFESEGEELIRLAYPFQFGVLVSGALLLIHFGMYVFVRKRRNG